MSSIDERIVGMKFQNSQFQKAAADSLKTLQELKDGLNLQNAARSLSDISAQAGRFSLQTMADGVDTIQKKFSNLGVVGIAALASITNQAVQSAQRLISSVTSDPIGAGFSEYETKLGSIQTILANTAKQGTNLEQVNAALSDLNDYSDKTIYNFGDMTKNIGLFTNAGIGLTDATSMIKGFSNEAASSGTTSAQAAGAAYQLSQALSAGTIRLMDWRSLQNVGMGNKNMQSGIIEIAQAMGTLDAAGTNSEEVTAHFNETLEKGWLTADVMSTYLKTMAGDMDDASLAAIGLNEDQIASFKAQQQMSEDAAQKVRTWTQLIGTLREAVGSGWAETFEHLLGDFDQATEFFTYVNDTLGPLLTASGDQRNAMLQTWEDLGGRYAAVESLKNIFEALLKIITPLQQAFREIFPPMTGLQLAELSNVIMRITEGFIISDQTAANLKSTAKGLFAVLCLGVAIIKGVFSVIFRLIGAIANLGGDGGGGGFLGLTARIGEWLVKVTAAIQNGSIFIQFFQILGDVLVNIIGAIRVAVDWVTSLNLSFDMFDLGFLAGISAVFDNIGFSIGRIVDRLTSWNGVADFFVAFWERTKSGLEAVARVLQPITDAFAEFFGSIWNGLKDSINSGDFAPLLDVINTGLLGGFILIIKGFLDKTSALGDGVVGGLVDTIKSVFGELNNTMKAMQTNLKADALMQIAIAIAVLTASVLVLSLIDSGKLTAALTAMTVMFGQLVGSLAILDKSVTGIGVSKLPVIAAALILLGIAMNFMAAAVAKLGSLSWTELLKGLLGLGVTLAIMVKGVTALSKTSGMAIQTGAAIAILAVAIYLLSSSVEKLGGLDFGQMVQGLLGLGGVLGALLLFVNLAKLDATSAISTIGLLGLASAVSILAVAVKIFATLDPVQLASGLVAVGITLAMIIGFLNRIPNPAGFAATAAGLIVLSVALLMLSQVVQIFGNMPLDSLAKGLGGLAAVLLILTLATNALPKNLPATAAGLVILGIALNAIAAALLIIGGMSLEQLITGLVGMGVALGILTLAVNAMQGSIGGAAALGLIAVALALLAPAIVLLGSVPLDQLAIGLGALAVGLGILVVAGYAAMGATPGLIAIAAAVLALGIATALAGAGILAIGLGILAFAAAMAILASIGPEGAEGLTKVLMVIIAAIPAAMAALALGIVAFGAVIAASGPQLVAAFVVALGSIITAIATVGPQLITTIKDLLLQLIASLGEVIPPLIEFATTFIITLVDALVVLIPKLVDAGLQIVAGILQGIANNIQSIVEAGADIVINFINGIANKIPAIIEAAINLIISFVEGLAQGIRDNTARMNEAASELADAIIDGIVSGLASGISTVVNKAKELAEGALNAAKSLLGIASPSKEFRYLGEFMGDGMAIGIANRTDKVISQTENMGAQSLSAMKLVMSRIGEMSASDLNGQPVIRPVLDMSAIKAGAPQLNRLMDDVNTNLRPNGTYARAASIGLGSSAPVSPFAQAANELQEAAALNVKFEQNNYSPKALSTAEIYRQQNNQISRFREELKKQ